MFCETGVELEETPAGDAFLENLIRNTLMASALSQLGTSCLDTLRRFYVDGETAGSIAASRETTPNSIHQLLNYCRERARKAYREMSEATNVGPTSK